MDPREILEERQEVLSKALDPSQVQPLDGSRRPTVVGVPGHLPYGSVSGESSRCLLILGGNNARAPISRPGTSLVQTPKGWDQVLLDDVRQVQVVGPIVIPKI